MKHDAASVSAGSNDLLKGIVVSGCWIHAHPLKPTHTRIPQNKPKRGKEAKGLCQEPVLCCTKETVGNTMRHGRAPLEKISGAPPWMALC